MKTNFENILEILIQGEIQKELHKRQFYEFANKKENKGYFLDKLSDVQGAPDVDISVGQLVDYTSGNGVVHPSFEVLAFSKPTSYGGCVYLNFDCYWFPVRPERLKPAKPATKEEMAAIEKKITPTALKIERRLEYILGVRHSRGEAEKIVENALLQITRREKTK
ncbi:MAG: hypothetical protein LBF55_07555 [Prevotellaceae bacterium]|jgi:hypothetical protein|nr:hypothetical protein [Prevotellaceae bacterium]